MQQTATTLVAKILPDAVDRLEAILAEINADPSGNRFIRLSQVKRLHFACWIILSRDARFKPCLVLELSHDGPSEAFLDALAAIAPSGLDAIYANCFDYPAGAATPASVAAYLKRIGRPAIAFYVGCADQTCDSVLNAMATRERIEEYLDTEESAGRLQVMAEAAVHKGAVAAVRENPPFPTYPGGTTVAEITRRAQVNIAFWALLGLVLLGPILLFLLVFTPLLLLQEARERRTPTPKPPDIDPRLFGVEDLTTQNHLTTLVDVKPGAFRLFTLKFVLFLIGKFARTVFITGSLGGIPTIHFARWLLIDDNRRLLFFSNYDGSWASYLGDFVDRANYGLTAVWGNTVDFPPSYLLAFGGAQHIEAFKLWSRQHNEFAQVWYSAYPNATVLNITAAVNLRDGLASKLSGARLKTWLRGL